MLVVERVLALQDTAVFANVPQDSLTTLASYAREMEITAGETLFAAGDIGSSLFVVVDGDLGVFVGDQQVATLCAPAIVGEMAALDPEPRSATVKALTDGRLLEIGNALLQRYIDDNPVVGHAVIRLLCQRLRDANQRLVAEKNQ